MANNKAFKVKNGIDLAPISDTLTGTATDVFVYDTSKDSDGGQWRHRTQYASWYTEPLNTSTRGARREFPAVAVIVLQIGGFTIYDGDDPTLPMWWQSTTTNMGGFALAGGTAVHMLNGMMIITQSDGSAANYDGLRVLDFVRDYGFWTWYNVNGSIYEDNLSSSAGGVLTSSRYFPFLIKSGGLLAKELYDVDMMVMPNAPTDPITKLPVPTVALASASGAMVISDDGVVYDYTDAGGNYHANYNIKFDRNYRDVWLGASTWVGQGSRATYRRPIKPLDQTYNITSDRFFTSHASPGIQIFSSTNTQRLVTTKEGVAMASVGSGHPLYICQPKPSYTSDAPNAEEQSSLIAFVQTDFNTGYMVGSGATNNGCVMATLSSNDTTSVSGSELVTNGTFDSDTSGWTASALTTSVASGQATLTMTSTYGTFVQGITTVVGETYTISCDIVSETLSGALYLGAGTTSGGSQIGLFTTSVGGNAFTFVATATTTYVALYLNGASSQTAVIDNFTARPAVEDRSIEGDGVQIFGTVQKPVVNTDADLVGYGPFSGTNYLHQPHNPNLNFGVDDFTIALWAKGNPTSGASYLFDRGDSDGHSRIAIYMNSTNKTATFYTTNSSGTFAYATTGSQVWVSNNWHQWVFVRRGGRCFGYVDGVQEARFDQPNSLNNDNAPLNIGLRYNQTEALTTGQIALFRASRAAASPEQIQAMFREEKPLFYKNAKATLYGTDTIIRAVAYDDSTDLLHVGTGSGGRSMFQGLQRVDNTTAGVNVAISAANGLVADE